MSPLLHGDLLRGQDQLRPGDLLWRNNG